MIKPIIWVWTEVIYFEENIQRPQALNYIDSIDILIFWAAQYLPSYIAAFSLHFYALLTLPMFATNPPYASTLC